MKRRTFIQIAGSSGTMILIAPSVLSNSLEPGTNSILENKFLNPDLSDGPWVVWHWTSCNQTREGVTSDLEGMAAAGITAANLFSFPSGGMSFGGGGTVVEKPAEPLTPEWFELVKHAVKEAERVGIKLSLQISAGWATAGGDWIPPELSQQQIVWSQVDFEGGKAFDGKIPRPRREGDEKDPEEWRNYYRELAVLAFPVPGGWGETNITQDAKVTSNLPVTDFSKLTDLNNKETVIKTKEAGWIQFDFVQPFTLRSVHINPGGGGFFGAFNRPAHSMEVQAGNDGTNFRKIGALEPMANSWQTRLTGLVHSVPETTARYFRLVHHPAPPIAYDEHMQGDSYKGAGGGMWGQPLPTDDEGSDMLETINELAINSISLSSTARVHHYEGKTALVWGMSRRVSIDELPAKSCIPLGSIIDLTDKLNEDGSIEDWQPSEGKWRIMRFGYTTMGRTNGDGTGQGLEADKFSADGARISFNGWYKQVLDSIGPELSGNVLNMLNIDSWECGSQNWSPVFRDEFRERRGYDVLKYLPVMAGVSVESADVTENFLFDIRRTIADLISDNFLGTLYDLSHTNGSDIQMESVPPGMTADGLLVHKNVDVTAGEFWVTAWQNWKPCDIREATSGAQIYGKQIAMAEAFTGGGDWSEHPYDMKAMGDMHFAEGINRMMIHLWAAQPYPGRVPGQSGAAGTFFNQHTPWIKPGKAWIDYMRRCQALLQRGKTICDVAYFIGEDVPCRALIPPEYGTYFVTDPPLPEGYNFNSVNRDVLLNSAKVKNGKIVLESGVSYDVLVLRPGTLMTPPLINKIKELVEAGAVIVGEKPKASPSLEIAASANETVDCVANMVWGNIDGKTVTEHHFGKGRVFLGKTMSKVLSSIQVDPDLLFTKLTKTNTGNPYKATSSEPEGVNPTLIGEERKGWGMRWNHRMSEGVDYYFISNQEQFNISAEMSFRINGKIPEFWRPDIGKIEEAPVWCEENDRTIVPFEFDPAGSVFVVFRKPADKIDQIISVQAEGKAPINKLKLETSGSKTEAWASEKGEWSLTTRSGKKLQVRFGNVPEPIKIEGQWNVGFPLLNGTTKKVQLECGLWTESEDEDIKYFSGTATYKKEVEIPASMIDENQRLILDLGEVKNLATVSLNRKNLGVAWKPPYRIGISGVAKAGKNELIIEVTNTWKNRLIKDAGLPEEERETWVVGNMPPADSPLIPAGLLGPINIISEIKKTEL